MNSYDSNLKIRPLLCELHSANLLHFLAFCVSPKYSKRYYRGSSAWSPTRWAMRLFALTAQYVTGPRRQSEANSAPTDYLR
jgi:hypothetical protein